MSPDATVPPELEAVAERVRALSEQVVDQAKKNGLVWLESYERLLQNMLDLQEQAAKNTGAEWVSTLATTQANFVRETSSVLFGAMRTQLGK